jgi:hypothetical protein
MTGNTRNQQQDDLVAQRLATANVGAAPSNGKRMSQRYEMYRQLQKAAQQQTGSLRQRLSA